MKGDLEKLSIEFAVEILKFTRWLRDNREYIIADQVGRSGTSIGANIREAHYAQSKSDFINKMSIALKEANETDYWLDLADKTMDINEKSMLELKERCKTLKLMLAASVKTAKQTKKTISLARRFTSAAIH